MDLNELGWSDEQLEILDQIGKTWSNWPGAKYLVWSDGLEWSDRGNRQNYLSN